MVLQKVGEFLTTINVNGEQKIQTNQSEDNTYNLTDYQNVTINLDGSQEIYDNINSDKEYDLYSPTPQVSKYYSASPPDYEKETINLINPLNLNGIDIEYTLDASEGGRVGIRDIPKNDMLVQVSGGTKSGTLNNLTGDRMIAFDAYAQQYHAPNLSLDATIKFPNM